MAKIACLFSLFPLIIFRVAEALHEPFPQGYAMGNLGTIVTENGPAAYLPLFPAAYMGDSLFAGVAASVTTYYDDMDNFGNRYIATVDGGGWLVAGRAGFKLGISTFDALGAYRELTGRLSWAVRIAKGIRIGSELSGTRLMLNLSELAPKTLGEAGFTLFMPIRIICLTVTIDRLTIKPSGTEGTDQSLRVTAGVHTKAHAFGAQGVRIDVTPESEHPVSIAIGEELRISRYVTLHGAVANNPIFVGIGIAAFLGGGCASAAIVNHPVLGWSRGFGAQYGWKRSD